MNGRASSERTKRTHGQVEYRREMEHAFQRDVALSLCINCLQRRVQMLQSDKALRGTEGCNPRAWHRSTNKVMRAEQTGDAVHCASTALFYKLKVACASVEDGRVVGSACRHCMIKCS